ncbi:TPA: hypothetical protein N0F65_011831 [Lagenidium giganteum]|uniref:Ankyrin repeat protein n=1 Tax=Lagenidium giganteum TaxID=4803 RepID=A0AAV2Z3C4_9STRA|nr:TPA: hypothetical protein N0F65_011831 [Lagenidium giganteum]
MGRTTSDHTPAAMEGAACHGRLDIVRFLFEEYGVRCPMFTLAQAAANGHLAVIKFLVEQCRHPPLEPALPTVDAAAVNGQLDVVRFLVALRSTDCLPGTIEQGLG